MTYQEAAAKVEEMTAGEPDIAYVLVRNWLEKNKKSLERGEELVVNEFVKLAVFRLARRSSRRSESNNEIESLLKQMDSFENFLVNRPKGHRQTWLKLQIDGVEVDGEFAIFPPNENYPVCFYEIRRPAEADQYAGEFTVQSLIAFLRNDESIIGIGPSGPEIRISVGDAEFCDIEVIGSTRYRIESNHFVGWGGLLMGFSNADFEAFRSRRLPKVGGLYNKDQLINSLFDDTEEVPTTFDYQEDELEKYSEQAEEENPLEAQVFFSVVSNDRRIFRSLRDHIYRLIGGGLMAPKQVHDLSIFLHIIERLPYSESWFSSDIQSIWETTHGTNTMVIEVEGDTIRFSQTYVDSTNEWSESETQTLLEIGVGWREDDSVDEIFDFMTSFFEGTRFETHSEVPDEVEWDFEPASESWQYAINKTIEEVL